MHELAAGQDTQKSWPVGITGFGLGVTDQPRAEALTGTEALAGIVAAPARTTVASRTDTFAALRLTLPSGRFAQNFMITPNASVAVRGDSEPCSGAGRWGTGRHLFVDRNAGAEPDQVHEP